MKKIVKPMYEKYYPDEGGYTGFAIFIWDVRNLILNDVALIHKWGAFTEKVAESGNYLLEARFFVFGSLPKHFVTIKYSEEEINPLKEMLISLWTPIMDTIIRKEEELNRQKYRHSIHVEEVLTSDIIDQLNSIVV